MNAQTPNCSHWLQFGVDCLLTRSWRVLLEGHNPCELIESGEAKGRSRLKLNLLVYEMADVAPTVCACPGVIGRGSLHEVLLGLLRNAQATAQTWSNTPGAFGWETSSELFSLYADQVRSTAYGSGVI